MIREATISDIEPLAVLFDGYRQFYNQPSDVQSAMNFLSERISKRQSVVLISYDEATPKQLIGFVQLYPSFTSVGMRTIWVLNDLFVGIPHRRDGHGKALLKAAMEFSHQSGARNLVLQTAKDNESAQKLYEHLGWKREEKFFTYNFHH